MENYIGEIRIFAGNYAPANWAFCRGQAMNISEYDVLFTLLGTTYGGDGMQTFCLPNLHSRVVVGQGTGPGLSPYVIGQATGSESVTLTTSQLAMHRHPLAGSVTVMSGGTAQADPKGAYYGDSGGNTYDPNPSGNTLAASSLIGQTSVVGGGNPHPNIQPVLALHYIIALTGIFPPQS